MGKGADRILEVTNIFKPSAPLTNVIEDLGNLGKCLTKEDHIVIMGGPGNSLDNNYHYSVEEDLNFIAKRTSHTNVGLVNLFRRHNKPWMNSKVRSVNVRLDLVLLGAWHIPHQCYQHHCNYEGRIHKPWPAPKLTRREEAYASYC
jgi:hypothetical protein